MRVLKNYVKKKHCLRHENNDSDDDYDDYDDDVDDETNSDNILCETL